MRILLCLLLLTPVLLAEPPAKRMVLIDEDGSGPGGTNQMAMMLLLQSPEVQVLGITMVSGDGWEPENVQHTLRMLEIIHRTDVPVVPGAVFSLLHTAEEAQDEALRYGPQGWYGAWGAHHGPFEVPPLPEGQPTHKPASEDAAHFLIRQVHEHPHEVTIYAAGPLTNIALALSIDPGLPELAQGIVIMGGSLNPQTNDPEFALHPRHEFNFWFDPEAAHIVLRAPWPRIDLTPVDISLKTRFTKEMLAEIVSSGTPSGEYLSRYTTDFSYLWDELAAAALIAPNLITREQVLYLDVDTTHGPAYGDTLAWAENAKPARSDLRQVHVHMDLDVNRFNRSFLERMRAAPSIP